MKNDRLDIVILGLSITSSWGNGHATTFRGLVRELHKNGHTVTFLERDVPWYASNRDLTDFPYCSIHLYKDLDELRTRHEEAVRKADLVMVGSYVPEGVEAGKFVVETAGGITAFYDIDTPVTLAKIERGDYEYIHPELIAQYHMYLSFTGGPTLDRIEQQYGSPMARPFYCSFDPELYYPEQQDQQWELGYLGTYSADRQPPLHELMVRAAEHLPESRFVVAGPQYPADIAWPANVERIEHLPPAQHRAFYNSQRFTLNITRADMIRAGYSPSVRLFEAAACRTPIISDYWDGLDSIFEIGREILISRSAEDTVRLLRDTTDPERDAIAERAFQKVLLHHTAAHRATELEQYYQEALTKTGISKTVGVNDIHGQITAE
ncbi:CgeB family protein [Dyadobacter sandarakinus]|uniref:Glycosyltransferase n=1 Tax=Dyadobacter sandarakinus TaxID=2747268 RepID=A0ABX7I3H9_9BACT|nr:glycosyltransferase [Dyadobacter sandarakinus]QRR00298.1 glycosyltransferase [Dyadobacter sandarakinus]